MTKPRDLANSVNTGPVAGFRNLLINGNPTINQRGYVSGTNTGGANEYTLDRWRVVTSGQNIAFSTTAGICTVTAPAGGVEQVVEGASILGGSYVLSWTGTATATVNGNAVTNGGTVTLTGGSNATVRFSSGTFAQAQLEPGTVATAFEQRPAGVELLLCQRYFWRRSGAEYYGAGYFQSATEWNGCVMQWPVAMRTAPVLTFAAASNFTFGYGGGSLTAATITAGSITVRSANVYGTVASGGTTGYGSALIAGANASVSISAEF